MVVAIGKRVTGVAGGAESRDAAGGWSGGGGEKLERGEGLVEAETEVGRGAGEGEMSDKMGDINHSNYAITLGREKSNWGGRGLLGERVETRILR